MIKKMLRELVSMKVSMSKLINSIVGGSGGQMCKGKQSIARQHSTGSPGAQLDFFNASH